jgi:DNA-binding NtrC family response regulator
VSQATVSQTRALLVYNLDDPVSALRPILETQGIQTSRAQNCEQARNLLKGPEPPQLVFTDTNLPDGAWSDVLALARSAQVRMQVIVVSRRVDTKLFMDVLESRAFDFIVPPFRDSDLAYVVRCATWSISSHSQAA